MLHINHNNHPKVKQPLATLASPRARARPRGRQPFRVRIVAAQENQDVIRQKRESISMGNRPEEAWEPEGKGEPKWAGEPEEEWEPK